MMAKCDWAGCGKIDWHGDANKRVTVAWLKGSSCNQLLVPEGWTYEGSLTESFGFVPLGAEHSIEKVAEQGGVETFRSPLSDRPLYVGRTHSETAQETLSVTNHSAVKRI